MTRIIRPGTRRRSADARGCMEFPDEPTPTGPAAAEAAARSVILARVCWRSRINGASGHGDWIPLATAEAWRKRADVDFGDVLDHWIEFQGDDTRRPSVGE